MRTLLVGWLVLSAVPTFAQGPVPPRVQQIVETLAAQRPDLALGTDDQRRELTRSAIEQIVFEFPSDGWGWKSADPGRPPSKDSLARQSNAGLLGCDWQNGASRQVNKPIVCDAIPGQTFIPVAGVNHLGLSPAPPPVPTPQPPVPIPSPGVTVDYALIRSWMDVHAAQAERIFANLTTQIDQARAESNAGHSVLREQLRQMDENPSWLKKLFSNRYVQLGLAAVVPLLTKAWVVK